MHRSGTSALSGVLHTLGFHVPQPHIPTTSDNAAGFYESAPVRDYNDSVFARIGSSWHDPLPTKAASLAKQRADLDAELAALLATPDFVGPCLLKDPRFCLTAGLWLDALAGCGRPAHCILVGRHPFAVAASLRTRNGLPAAHALLLWLKHVTSAERLSRGRQRTFTLYDDLLGDWRASIGKVLADLDLGAVGPDAEPAVDAFLDRDLRHHDQACRVAHDALEQLCLEVWACLVDLAAYGESRPALDRLSAFEARYVDSVALLAPLLDRSLTEPAVTATPHPHLDGWRLRVADTPHVWLMFHGQRHKITSPYVYDALFSNADRLVTRTTLADIEIGSPLGAGACLIRAECRTQVFLLNQTDTRAVIRHHVASSRTFQAFGFDDAKVKTVPGLLVDMIPEGRELRAGGDDA